MDTQIQNSPLSQEPPPTSHWLNRHHYLATITFILFLAAAGSFIYWWTVANQPIDTTPVVRQEKPDETSGFQTYRNEKYGFEFRYPSELKGVISEDEFGASVSGNSVNLLVRVVDETEKISPLTDIISLNPRTINGLSVEEYYTNSNNTKNIYIPLKQNPGKWVEFYAELPYVDIDQILSTFKFIETVDTSGWKIYRNEGYGFEFKYPQDWTLKSTYSPTSSIPVISFTSPDSKFKLLIESNCCREGLIRYQEIPIQLDGNNWKYYLYGYAENLGEVSIDPYNPKRLAIQPIPAAALRSDLRLNEGIEIELEFMAKDQDDAIFLFNQILSTFRFAGLTGWKIYRNRTFGFEMQVPENVRVDLELNDEYSQLISFKGQDLDFEVRLKEHAGDIADYIFLEGESREQGELGGKQAVILKSDGYCDGPGCGPPYVNYAAKANQDSGVYNLIFYDDKVISETEKQTLASFKFIDIE